MRPVTNGLAVIGAFVVFVLWVHAIWECADRLARRWERRRNDELMRRRKR